MLKKGQPKLSKPLGERKKIVVHNGGAGEVTALLSHANHVIERVAAKALSGDPSRLTSVRLGAPHLKTLARELKELRKVIEALAMSSVGAESQAPYLGIEGITVIDADVACNMLNNPPEPNEALRNLLTLR